MAAIRGAICAQNNEKDISEKALLLVSEIIKVNDLDLEAVSSVIFSCTKDLNACYPAKSVREGVGLNNAAFMCLEEMDVPGALAHCIRVCLTVEGKPQKDCKHCYLGDAKVLRPDLR